MWFLHLFVVDGESQAALLLITALTLKTAQPGDVLENLHVSLVPSY